MFYDHSENNLVLKILLLLVIAAFALNYELAFRIPIYIDEVGWKILHARYFLDKHVSVTLFPQCRTSFSLSRPLVFILPSFFESFIYGDLTNLLKLRIGSLLYLTQIGRAHV